MLHILSVLFISAVLGGHLNFPFKTTHDQWYRTGAQEPRGEPAEGGALGGRQDWYPRFSCERVRGTLEKADGSMGGCAVTEVQKTMKRLDSGDTQPAWGTWAPTVTGGVGTGSGGGAVAGRSPSAGGRRGRAAKARRDWRSREVKPREMGRPAFACQVEVCLVICPWYSGWWQRPGCPFRFVKKGCKVGDTVILFWKRTEDDF